MRHAQRKRLARHLARIVLAAGFAAVELLASIELEWTPLGTALAIMAGWNVSLVGIGLLTLREDLPPRGGGVPR